MSPGPNSLGMWPSPVADGDRTTNYAQGGMSLGYAARLWPTPQANPYSVTTLTPELAEKSRRRTGDETTGSFVEVMAKRMWPTPTAANHITNPLIVPPSGVRGRLGHAVPAEDPSTIGGQLNPTWVEWLMGFPAGWTDLED